MPAPAQILAAIRAQPKIPAPSQAVSKVLELTRDPECAVPKLADVISKDPGLTVQLLRQANSALYGCANPTSSVNQACVRLGIKRVRSAVINQHIVNGLSKVFPKSFDPSRFWQSALAISVAAQELAKRVDPSCAEDAGTAGLLCDLGIGLLASAIPEEYKPVLAELPRVGLGGVHRLETPLIGLTHAETAAAVLTDWKLEAPIVDAVKKHHFDLATRAGGESGNEGPSPLARIVRSAVILSEIALDGSEMERIDDLFRHVETLAPQADALVGELLDSLVTTIQATAQSLSVELGDINDMEANLARLVSQALESEEAQA